MPKKYTPTDDGWIKVEELPSQAVVAEENALYQNNYYNKFLKEQKAKELEETKKINISSMPELVINSKPSKLGTKIIEEPIEQQRDNFDWQKEANKCALIAVAWIVGIAAILTGIIALAVYLIPGLTWMSIGEAIAFTILQIIYYLYKAFYFLCTSLFDLIFNLCGGKW